MDPLSKLYDDIDELVKRRLSFILNQSGYSLRVAYENQLRKKFIFEKANHRIVVGYEPFDMWCCYELIEPRRQLKMRRLKNDDAGNRLATITERNISRALESRESDLAEHLADIDLFLKEIASEPNEPGNIS